ncbi:MFS_1_like domain-containing protein [Trichonephila clavipes]|nr:MFS_1_like domain-containing protein [Trichonephila clavipes]
MKATEAKTTQIFKNDRSDFKTYQFWIFAFLFIGVNVCINGIYTLSDTALYESVLKNGDEFGKQRLFFCIGWGIGAAVGGFLTDYTNQYKANFIFFAFISLIVLWNIYKLDFVKPHFSKNILKDVGNTMNSREFLSFQIGAMLMGMGLAFTWFYLLWFVTSLGGNRVVCGLIQTVQSFTGDVPFFFLSGWFLRKIGYFNILSLALIACSARLVWYSQLENPWMVLPMEWSQGFTYGLFYAAMASFAKMKSKPGTEATTQSVIFGTFDGLGMS